MCDFRVPGMINWVLSPCTCSDAESLSVLREQDETRVFIGVSWSQGEGGTPTTEVKRMKLMRAERRWAIVYFMRINFSQSICR